MKQLLESITSSLMLGFLVPVLFAIPIFTLGVWLHRERKKQRAELVEPFTDKPLRPPGESLRLKLEQLNEDFDDKLITLVLIGALSAGIMVGIQPQKRLLFGAVLFLGNLAACIVIAPRLLKAAKSLGDCRLGYKGERVVGEELNQLMADGYFVCHDLVFEKYNIDHVIVGACGVFAVETKTRSKRTDARWEKKGKALFDGHSIKFNDYEETEAVAQARLNAKSLSRLLTEATGEPVKATAILVTPGWYIDNAPPIDGLTARNPNQVRTYLNALPPIIGPTQLTRIAHQLEQRSMMA